VDPRVSEYTCNGTGGWRRLDLPGQDLDVRVGSSAGASRPCATWLAPGTHTGRFAQQYAPDGLIVYVEAAEHDAATICRNLHGMRLAGFFTAANAVIVGRSAAPDQPQLTQDEAVLDALSPLGLPIVADVECGHVPPHLPIVNGARGRLWYSSTDGRLEQTLS
jgi:muramoyltetrapeptide carboxypeptidase LdcA involved in peptidoglycan recycling